MTAEQEAVEVLAEARCTDVHGDAYTAPWCHSCRGWAATVAAALAAAAGTTREAEARAWFEGALAMKKARLVQGESLPQNPYRAETTDD